MSTFVPCVRMGSSSSGITAAVSCARKALIQSGSGSLATDVIIPDAGSCTVSFPIFWFHTSIIRRKSLLIRLTGGSLLPTAMTGLLSRQ